MALADKKLCSGCGVCADVCGVNAIRMTESADGFAYPVIDEQKCTGCKKCERVCPVDRKPPCNSLENRAVYAVRSRSEEVVFLSTSGGAFATLATATIEAGGKVFGAGFCEEHSVVYKGVERIEDLPLIMGSKYVEANLGNTYREVKETLESGRRVLFAGTPCKASSLRAYLQRDYDNLLIVDFVCHGVPSKKLYKKYLDDMSKDKDISSVCFRDKTIGDGKLYIGIKYEDGSVYRRYTPEDPYMLMFIQNISLRKSCYNCAFKGFNSGSDITLGDFWGIEDTDSVLKDTNSVSLLIVGSEKGANAFEEIKDRLDFDRRTMEEALRKNSGIVKSVAENPLREDFFRDMHKLTTEKLCKKYCSSSISAKLRRYLARCR